MQRPLASVIALALGGSALGVTACTTPPKPLACSAAVSSAFPAHGATEAITVHSVAGAKVLTIAGFKTGSSSRSTTTNALGLARTAYNIGTAVYGLRVPVSVLVVKGSQTGSCATSFTPRAPAPTGPVVKSVDPQQVKIDAKTLKFFLTVSCTVNSGSAKVHIFAREDPETNGSAAPAGAADSTIPCSTTGSDQDITITSTGGDWYENRLEFKIDTVVTSGGKTGPTKTFFRSIAP